MSTVKSPVKRFLAAVTALTLALVVLVSSTSLSASAYSLYTAKVDNSTLAYDATITSTQKQWKQLADQEANEGFVLMKNSNNCLPIDTSKGNVKVNLLGYCGYNPVYSGAGSGALKGTDVVSFKDTLATNGFVVNPALEEEGVYEVEESDEGLLVLHLASLHPVLLRITRSPSDVLYGSGLFCQHEEVLGYCHHGDRPHRCRVPGPVQL